MTQTSELLELVRAHAMPAPVSGPGTKIWQRGTLLRGSRWLRFSAVQQFDASDIGFEWKAKVNLGPIRLTVTDAFRNGEGSLSVHVMGLRAGSSRGPEIAQAQVQRFLAELPWCPLAMANPSLHWSAIGEDTLEVSTPVSGETVSVRLSIDEAGRVIRSEAVRLRQAGKRFEPTRWLGEFSDYREMGGMRLPARAEVAWALPDSVQTYWRGEVTGAQVIGDTDP